MTFSSHIKTDNKSLDLNCFIYKIIVCLYFDLIRVRSEYQSMRLRLKVFDSGWQFDLEDFDSCDDGLVRRQFYGDNTKKLDRFTKILVSNMV